MEHKERVLGRVALKRLANLYDVSFESIQNVVKALAADKLDKSQIYNLLIRNKGNNTHNSGRPDEGIKKGRVVRCGRRKNRGR